MNLQTLEFGLPFFAKFLQVDESELNYVVLKRKYKDGGVFLTAGLSVRDVTNYAFDLTIGQFVPIGKRADGIITIEKAVKVNTEEGIILRTMQGHSIPFMVCDFKEVYTFRVVNKELYL